MMDGKLLKRFEEKYIPVTESGCWIWIGSTNQQNRARMMINGKNRNATYAAWELFRGPVPKENWLCHHCDVPECVNPDHLYLGTPRTNADDMVRRGRHKVLPGEQNGNARLSNEMVKLIRDCYTLRESVSELSARFGISRRTILRIIRRVQWKRVP